MRRHALYPVLGTLLVLGACRPASTSQEVLRVEIRRNSASVKATCVRLLVEPTEGDALQTGPMAFVEKEELRVAVYKDALTQTVTLLARGYVDSACEGPLNVESDPQIVTFASGIQTVEVTLNPALFDADGDGFRSTAKQGPDCNDLAAQVHPGATESCTDGLDNNCQDGADCQDTVCRTKPCAAGGTCSAGGICLGQTNEASCADGFDNDADLLIDCVDPDCNGLACQDGNGCTTTDVCQALVCVGTSLECKSPPTQCHQPVGSCSPSSGCTYGPANQQPCDGGLCNGSFGCIPTFRQAVSNIPDPIPLAEASSALVINCAATIDTRSPPPRFDAGCVGFAPAHRTANVDGGQPVLMVATQGLTVGPQGRISVLGTTPVVFVVYGDVLVQPGGSIDVSAAGSSDGPGYQASACVGGNGQVGTMANDGASGGGGGGGFGSEGADGGQGNGPSAPGARGLTAGESLLVPLRAGCRGGPGGNANNTTGGGAGGAIQISATGNLRLGGRISAAGGGGGGGDDADVGGGGGGSGGGILLEGQSLQLESTGRITANGGGGGEGGGNDDGAPGADGITTDDVVAPGGNAALNTLGGAGGGGATGKNVAVSGSQAVPGDADSASGGGGGGGTGRIRINVLTGCDLKAGSVISGKATSNKDRNSGCL